MFANCKSNISKFQFHVERMRISILHPHTLDGRKRWNILHLLLRNEWASWANNGHPYWRCTFWAQNSSLHTSCAGASATASVGGVHSHMIWCAWVKMKWLINKINDLDCATVGIRCYERQILFILQSLSAYFVSRFFLVAISSLIHRWKTNDFVLWHSEFLANFRQYFLESVYCLLSNSSPTRLYSH